jgi:hypothetical protein|tara:strand:- start:85 stop:624 length:540 start_codon:yes stop_codon:yes gene_type:complete
MSESKLQSESNIEGKSSPSYDCTPTEPHGVSIVDTKESDILTKAADFFMGEEFQDAIDTFVNENYDLFADQTEVYADADHVDEDSDEYLPSGITRGHSLKQHAAYESFQRLFEEKLESFVERHGVDRVGFLRQCKSAISDDVQGIENMGTVFVDLLLATSEYEGFVTMMASQAKELCRK